MAKLWVARTALEGFNLFSHVGTALKVAWLPLIISVAAELVFSVAMSDAAVDFERRSLAIEASGVSDQVAEDQEMEALFVLLGDIAWPALGMVVVMTAAYSMAFAGWMRFLLIGQRPGERVVSLRFGSREFRFFIAYIVWSVLWLLMFGVVAAITYFLIGLYIPLGVIAGLALAALAVVLTARPLLVLPMIALDEGMGWVAAWRLSRGNVWRLSVGLGLAFVLALIALVLIKLVLPTFGDETSLDITAASAVDIVIQQVLSMTMLMILCGSVADAYRQLGGPGLGVSEEVLQVFDG